MKKILALLLLAGMQASAQNSEQKTDTVSLLSNGYVYPVWRDSTGEYTATPDSWSNVHATIKVFFYPKTAGDIQVALQVQQAKSDALLHLTLDGQGKGYDVHVKPGATPIVLHAGQFHITKPGYHFVQIKVAKGVAKQLPVISSLLMNSGLELKYNKSQYRGAAATHLSCIVPKEPYEWLYSEIKVPVGVDATNAYYMTNGFNGGYMGIQVNSKTERRILFSIWSYYQTDNPAQIPAEYEVKLLKKGKGVVAKQFGGEGSGGQSFLRFPWKNGNTYKLLVRAQAQGTHTIFTGYFYAPETGRWQLIAQWDQAKSGGKLLDGMYSFVENFADNGDELFKAYYGNQWCRTPAGEWVEATRLAFTTTASEKVHQRYDIGAGVDGNFVYMFSGGFKDVDTNIQRVYERKATGTPPNVDLSALPDN
ncbi:DUF3472 domain-containing protein [Chitinophaga vietnamensis]|uniref:DUF3472 domain-containing protein n=1 Tax=Chitinophaga vietnamensis TaxID=2593957 RepID=UPI0011773DE1|nr:DUF3472 domain-containing protein [Chitinophaga vietnamensis]